MAALKRPELLERLRAKHLIPGGFHQPAHVLLTEDEWREVIRIVDTTRTARKVPREATR